MEINKYFPGESRLTKLDILIAKIRGSIPEDKKDLIVKSIDFAFSQDENFIKEYIIAFIDESYNAYNGAGDNTSCVKGMCKRNN